MAPPTADRSIQSTLSGGDGADVTASFFFPWWRFTHAPVAENRVWAAQIAANGAQPWLHVTGFYSDVFDRRGLAPMRELFNLLDKRRDVYGARSSAAEVAVVCSRHTLYDVGAAEPDRYYLDRFRGACNALMEANIPFDLLSDKRFSETVLGRDKALSLPNLTCMGDDATAAPGVIELAWLPRTETALGLPARRSSDGTARPKSLIETPKLASIRKETFHIGNGGFTELHMYRFEQCYKRTRRQLKNLDFFKALPDSAFKSDLSLVFDSEGPNRKFNGTLLALRSAIKDSKGKSLKSEGEVLVAGCAESKGKNLIGKITNAFSDVNDRVAAVKMARHLYLMRMRGGQDVWVFSPPKAYTEWLYDEFAGLDQAGLAIWASQDDETYSDAEKQAMADATQLALRWSMKCVADLGAPSAKAKAVIRRWFCDDASDDKDVDKIAKKLLGGFGKISNVLNSNRLVLSDEPIDRDGGGWKDYAFVYQSERMNVIYIQKATLTAALGAAMWDAALTIVHELSHREMKTDDVRYADDGPIGPAAVGGISAKGALNNADSWGFFSADLNGALSVGKRTTASGLAA